MNKHNQYKGKLTPSEASIGIRSALINAKDLLADAELLFINERYPRAYSLAVLAIEETGKVGIIRRIINADETKELKRLWNNYRNHVEKNRHWKFPNIVAEKNGKPRKDDLLEMYKDNKYGKELETAKQLAFYTDCINDNVWINPKNWVTREYAKGIIEIAEIFVKNSGNVITAKELELWKKHMKPAKNTSFELMRDGLRNFYKEAKESGVLSKRYSNEDMESFFNLLDDKSNL